MTCDKCNGSGRIALSEHLQETLSLVQRGSNLCADDLHEILPNITRNAQNNRLERLRGLGLLTRTRHGKFWRYSRA